MDGMLIKYLEEYSTLKRSKGTDEDSLLDYYPHGAGEESYPTEAGSSFEAAAKKVGFKLSVGQE
jgi:hypothetical protein